MEEALRSPNHLGHDCGFLRDDLCAVAVYQLAAILPGARTPHERGAGGRCCRRPLFFGCVGAVFGGWLCDFLTRRGWTPMGGRKLLISCALLGISLCMVGTVLAQSNTIALTLISVSLFLIYISSSAAWATVPIAAPPQYTASLGSMQNFGGYLGGALAPTVTGFIVQRPGRFSQALILSAVVSLCSAAAYRLLVGQPIHADEAQ